MRSDRARADLVSVEVDAVEERAWRRVDRPADELELEQVLEGIRSFARGFTGILITETMLVGHLKAAPSTVERTAAFIAELAPDRACLAVPTRPPAGLGPAASPEPWPICRPRRWARKRLRTCSTCARRRSWPATST